MGATLARRQVPDLYGAAEAAAALGVGQTNLRTVAGLPEPVAVLKCGSIWRAADIHDLAAKRAMGRMPKPADGRNG